MAIAAIRADVHQSLDVHRDLGAESALYAQILFDRLAEAIRVSVVQIPNSLFRIHSGISENLSRGGAADSVDVRQPDLELLLAWQIHAGDTCHLSLSLLVLGVSLADDAHHSGALDHLAVLTNWFDAAAYFHKCSYRRANIPAGRGEGIPS